MEKNIGKCVIMSNFVSTYLFWLSVTLKPNVRFTSTKKWMDDNIVNILVAYKL